MPSPSNGQVASIVPIAAASGTRTIAITPTHEGDRFYVLLTGTDSAFINNIVAGATPVDLAIDLSSGVCEHQWAWTWLSPGAAPGTDSIVVNADAGAAYAGYALVFSGLSPEIDLGIGEGEAFADGSTGDAIAPPLPTAQGNVMVSAVATCGSSQPDLLASEFAGMPPINGVAVAYAIANGAKQTDATWQVHGQEWQTYSLVLH
jgi:hypothetical protein